MPSAIELYKRAYDLDFRNGDIDYAETLYNEIIEKFPESEEREYASIHLERIRRLRNDPQNPILKSAIRKDGVNGMVIFNFMLTMLLLVSFGFGAWFLYSKDRELKSLTFVADGQISEKQKNYGNAIEKYLHASKFSPHNPLPHRCLAELYLKQKEFKLAGIEANQWLLLAPNDPDAKLFKERFTKQFGE